MVAGGMLLAMGVAQGAEKIQLGLGGFWHAFAVYGDQSDGPGKPGAAFRDHGIAQDSEIHFRGETTLDNGISFGVSIQLEGETKAPLIDESFIFVEGTFGRVNFGQENPASELMYYGSPWAIDGVGLASPDLTFSQLGNSVGAPAVIVNVGGKAERITYFTPRMGGLQLGLSYTPDNCAPPAVACTSAGTGLQSKRDTGQQSETIEAAVNYVREFGGLNLALYAAISQGTVEGTAAAVTAAGAEDQDQWGLGMELGYGGFTFGADYRKDNQGTFAPNTDRTDYSLGLSYRTGPWTTGVAYAHGEVEEGAGLGQDETDGYQAGVGYNLGPGIVLTGGITYWVVGDNLNSPTIENKSTEFIIGTLLAF